MPIENQDETVALLTSPAAFGSSLATVRIVQTHISLVILSGERAIKLKRAVRLPYVDFSTAERRLAICQQELVLNRLTAPELYRAVHKVTREPDGSLALNGTGSSLTQSWKWFGSTRTGYLIASQSRARLLLRCQRGWLTKSRSSTRARRSTGRPVPP
jgi:hypothetical protein